jgi:hypothetical protein
MPAGLLIQEYWLGYDLTVQNVNVWLRTNETGWSNSFNLPPEKAVFVSDLLRNEKPVYLNGNYLQTGPEPVGESTEKPS